VKDALEGEVVANDLDLFEELRVARGEVEETSLDRVLCTDLDIYSDTDGAMVLLCGWLLVDLRDVLTKERRSVGE
jgi:hypothetical protein